MNERVIISCRQLQQTLEAHRASLDAHNLELIVPVVKQQLSEGELLDLIPGVHGIIAGDDQITRHVLERATEMRIVSKWGVGTDGIDRNAAAELGIRVTNTPGMFGDEVADVVIGYLVLLARHLHATDRLVRSGAWPKPAGVSLAGRTLVVIGLGDIGRAVAERAMAMKMRVLGVETDATNAGLARDAGVEVTGLAEAFSQADAVSVNCPLTPETRHLVGEAQLRSMPEGAWIINTARGPILDEQALIEALRAGQLGGAALDVFEDEPLPADSPLRQFDNVILGSHNASNTTEAVHRTSERAIANLLQGLEEVTR
jgi:D-3-phosphoglycerate dehydrogenase